MLCRYQQLYDTKKKVSTVTKTTWWTVKVRRQSRHHPRPLLLLHPPPLLLPLLLLLRAAMVVVSDSSRRLSFATNASRCFTSNVPFTVNNSALQSLLSFCIIIYVVNLNMFIAAVGFFLLLAQHLALECLILFSKKTETEI